MKVLVMAAHPDDTEVLCAGTLALLASHGVHAAVAHMTVGDKGGTDSRDEMARTRAAEAKASCDLIGAKYIPGFCGDLELFDNAEHQARMLASLQDVRPDVVLTHAPNDYHPDHRTTSVATVAAVYTSALPIEVWYMDNLGGVDFVPETYVDIGATFDSKLSMLRCHESQIAWMTKARHTDMEYMIDWISRWRGLQSGLSRAEGFRCIRGDGTALLSVLGSAVVRPRLSATKELT